MQLKAELFLRNATLQNIYFDFKVNHMPPSRHAG